MAEDSAGKKILDGVLGGFRRRGEQAADQAKDAAATEAEQRANDATNGAVDKAKDAAATAGQVRDVADNAQNPGRVVDGVKDKVADGAKDAAVDAAKDAVTKDLPKIPSVPGVPRVPNIPRDVPNAGDIGRGALNVGKNLLGGGILEKITALPPEKVNLAEQPTVRTFVGEALKGVLPPAADGSPGTSGNLLQDMNSFLIAKGLITEKELLKDIKEFKPEHLAALWQDVKDKGLFDRKVPDNLRDEWESAAKALDIKGGLKGLFSEVDGNPQADPVLVASLDPGVRPPSV